MVWTDIGLKICDLSAEVILKPLWESKWNWMRFLHLRISQKVGRYPKNIKVASINYTYSPIAIQINGCVSTQRNYQTNSGPEKQKNK